MEQQYDFFVGIDWATQEHRVCIVDPNNAVVDEGNVAHSRAGLTKLADQLKALSGNDLSRVAVAIEVPRGAVVEMLVEQGAEVYSINPKQLDRFRDRHTVAGAKDDRRDAYVLADSLRTDQLLFHRVRVDDPVVIQLRELSRMDEELCKSIGRLTNRLREQLNRYVPQLLTLSPAAAEPWLWSLLEIAARPEQAQKLKRAQVAKVLKAHRIRRVSAPEVLKVLRIPPLQVAPGTIQAASTHILMLAEQLKLVHKQRVACTAGLKRTLDQLECGEDSEPEPQEQSEGHRDAEIIRSIPGVGNLVAATMLGEASQPLAERNYHALRAHAGIAPVTRQSGKSCSVIMRRACNKRLRNMIYHWARVSVQRDVNSRIRYRALREKGHSHGRALRGVADRLLRMLIAMLKHGTLFNLEHSRRVPVGPI